MEFGVNVMFERAYILGQRFENLNAPLNLTLKEAMKWVEVNYPDHGYGVMNNEPGLYLVYLTIDLKNHKEAMKKCQDKAKEHQIENTKDESQFLIGLGYLILYFTWIYIFIKLVSFFI